MKTMFFALVITLFIIIVQCLQQSETNIKQTTVLNDDTYGRCRQQKNGQYICHCSMQKVTYDRKHQICTNGIVVPRHTRMNVLRREPVTPIRRSTRDLTYPGIYMGLQRADSSSVVPLRHVSAEAWIHSFAADVTITQKYYNPERYPIEAVYIFPIEENAAIYEFTAQIEDRLITAVVKEKQEAETTYAHAIQQGQTAVLLRQNERTFDTFKVNVGALPPGKECTVKIRYVTELDLIDGSSVRFVVPTTIAPRYDPMPRRSVQSLYETEPKYVQNISYLMSFRARIDRGKHNQIFEVANMSHPINISGTYHTIIVSSQNFALDRDFILDIDLPRNRSAVLIGAEQYDNGSKLAVLTVLSPGNADFISVLDAQNPLITTTEFIFIIDCSYSMEDEYRIDKARDAMLLFIRSLPIGAHFNIIRFGTHYTILFNETTLMTAVYNEHTARHAEALARMMKADLGGTDILEPLRYLKNHPPVNGRSRQVFILTDGEVANTNEVIEFCRSMALTTRIFSFGLGPTSSRSLVKGLARATNGHFIFVPPNSTVDEHVGIQLRRALQPSFINGRLKWSGLWPIGSQAPKTITPVYSDDRLLVYTLFDNFHIQGQSASVDFSVENGRIGNMSLRRNEIRNGHTIRRLAAKALIQELIHRGNEEHIYTGMTTKQQIIALSLTHQILSPYTAFVGVETRRSGRSGISQNEHVPIHTLICDEYIPSQHSSSSRYQQHIPSPSIPTHSSTRMYLFPATTSSTRPPPPPFERADYADRNRPIAIESPEGGYYASAPLLPLRPIAIESPGGGHYAEARAPPPPALLGRGHYFSSSSSTPRPLLASLESGDYANPYRPQAQASLGGYTSEPYHEVGKISTAISRDMNVEQQPSVHKTSTSTMTHSDKEENQNQLSIISSSRKSTAATDLLRKLIQQQSFNGAWILTDDEVKEVTGGKPTSYFMPTINQEKDVITTALIIALIESKYEKQKSLWFMVVEKGRQQLLTYGLNKIKINLLINEIKNKL